MRAVNLSEAPPRTASSLEPEVGRAHTRKFRESTKRRKLVRRVNACIFVKEELRTVDSEVVRGKRWRG
jgi:hypothetical protein